MLKRISIENFKGIGPRIDIELRPITLLFGPNSAGKSSILHALHYAHAVLESGNADVGRTRLGGDIDLGGFQQLVHDHDLEAAVSIGFGLRLDAGDLAYFFEGGTDPYEQREVMAELDASPRTGQTPAADLGNMYAGIGEVPVGDWSLEVEMRIRWSPYLRRPMVDRFTVRWWDQPFAEVGASLDGAHVWVTNVHMAHPMLRPYAADASAVPRLLTTKLGCQYGRGNALPRRRLYIEDVDAVGGVELARDIDDHLHKAATIVQDKLERVLYVGPVRAVVPRHYQPPKHPQRARWANGLGAWDALAHDAVLRERTSRWLGAEHHLDTGYRIDWHRYRELDDATFQRMQQAAQNFELDESFLALAHPLPQRGRLVVVDETKNLELAPCDLGEGINQVVPVIAAALAAGVMTAGGLQQSTELVAIEQPELHIHPRMVLKAFLSCLLELAPAPSSNISVTVHCGCKSTLPFFEENATKLAKRLPQGVTVFFKRWEEQSGGERFHNRYLLTDIGGVTFGVGMDEGKPGQTEDINLMDVAQYRLRWRQFGGGAPALTLVDEPAAAQGQSSLRPPQENR